MTVIVSQLSCVPDIASPRTARTGLGVYCQDLEFRLCKRIIKSLVYCQARVEELLPSELQSTIPIHTQEKQHNIAPTKSSTERTVQHLLSKLQEKLHKHAIIKSSTERTV